MREKLVLAGLAGRTFGHYEVLELVGGGGMSTVYKAYDLSENEEVALKVLSPALAEQGSFSDRFTREANLVIQLKHPNIVPVHDFGREKGYSYLVMPYLDAGNLAQYIRGGPLTLAWVAEVIDQIAKGLEYAHQRGVVHRDLKPSNILLDEHGRVMLSDFGVAYIPNSGVSLTGSTLLGTPAYISPEQALGKKVEPRSDQYSLGVLLFQLTTGELPFIADSPAAVLLQHIHDPLPLPREINPAISEPIEQVILKTMAKDPVHRFSSVKMMNTVFQKAVAHAFDAEANPAPAIQLIPHLEDPKEEPEVPVVDQVNWIRRTGNVIRLTLLFLTILSIGAVSAMSLQALSSNTSLAVPEKIVAELTAQAEIIEIMSTEIAQTISEKSDTEQILAVVNQTLAAGSAQTTTPAPPPTETALLQPSANWTPTTAESQLSNTQASQSALLTVPPPSQTPTSSATPTSTTNVCSSATLTSFRTDEHKAKWNLTNNGSTTIEITETSIEWPSSNIRLRKVVLGGEEIWQGPVDTSPTSLAGDWDKGSRQVASGDGKTLGFRFDGGPALEGYSVTVTLNYSCQIFVTQ